MEKEKQLLITKFENAFKKKNQVDAEIVKDLFPEDQELYNRIKKLTDKINNVNESNSGINFSSSISNDLKKSEIKENNN